MCYTVGVFIIAFGNHSMKKHFKRITPSKTALQKHKMLRPIAHWLANPLIWHFNRKAIALSVAIGFFFGSFPIAGQMLLAAVVAVLWRANMPVAIAATWISNPLTMPFFYTANYYFGAWLLRQPTIHVADIDWTLNGLLALGGDILVPLYFGSLVVGLILFTLAILSIRVMWRVHIVSYLNSRKKRHLAKKHRKE